METTTPLHVFTWTTRDMSPRRRGGRLPWYIQSFYEPEKHRAWTRFIYRHSPLERGQHIQEALGPTRRRLNGARYHPVLYNDGATEENDLLTTRELERVDRLAQRRICRLISTCRTEFATAPRYLEERIAADLCTIYDTVFETPAPHPAPETPELDPAPESPAPHPAQEQER